MILLVAACFVAYGNSMFVPFSFDDYAYLVDNPLIRDFGHFRDYTRIDTHHLNIDLKYNFILRPVAYVTFSLNYHLAGLDPGGFHLANILIHTVNALLVYLLAKLLLDRASGWGGCPAAPEGSSYVSLFAALVFAVHPLQTEAVTYIIQRFTSLATLFCLLAIVLYLKFRTSPRRGARIASYLGALLATLCAMKTKEIAFTLPLVLVMIELFFFTGDRAPRLLRLVPFVLTMAIIPVTVLELSAGSGAGSSSALERGINLVNFSNVSANDYAVTQLRVMVTYLRLFLVPAGQNLDYDYPLYHSLLDYRILLSVAVIAAVAGTGIRLFRESLRGDSGHPVQP